MKEIIKKNCPGIILIIFILLSVMVFPQRASAADFYLNITYDEPVCGEPVSFYLNGMNGSGNYQYRLSSVYQYMGNSEWEFIVDSSYLPGYSTASTIDFSFYASGTYSLRFYVMDVNSRASAYKTVQITINDTDYPDLNTKADIVAAECLKTCSSDFDKAVWLHDWLINNMSYDKSYRYCGTEGALARGKGTCLSYHNAYTMLLKRVGVECGESRGNGHIWTAVKLDGEWYQVDVTWDDPNEVTADYSNYLYFGLTDDLMKIAHNAHNPVEGQESTHLENNYLIKSGLVKTWSDPLAARLQTELDKGNTDFTVYFTDANPKSIRDIYNSLAVWELEHRDWIANDKFYKLDIEYEGQNTSVSNNNSLKVSASLLDSITIKDGTWKINKTSIPENTRIILASYDENGKMLDAEIVTPDNNDKTTWKGECTLAEGEYTKAFVVDENMKPVEL